MSVHWPILRRLAAHPGRVAVIDDRRQWKSIHLLLGAARLAGEIERVSRSRTLAVMLPTSGAFPMAALAGWMLGRAIVPLNYLLAPDELQYVVSHCEADTLVTVQPMLDLVGGPPRAVRILRLEDINFHRPPAPMLPARAAPDDLAAILYTSGTSGRPKGVMLSHGNIAANISQTIRWVNFSPRDRALGVLPLFDSFGFTVLTLLPLTCGFPVVYLARFVPQQIIRALRQHRPTLFLGVASMYGALLSVKDAGPDDFRGVRLLVSGGEALPEPVFHRFFERFGVRICQGYGLTETSPVTNWCRPDEFRLGSVGGFLPDVRGRIVDLESGRDLPPGHEGEIRLAGPNVMQGYFKRPDDTAAAFDELGFLRTGDIGALDDEGRLSITGRFKEMMIISGENVFPREIEDALESHSDVTGAGVIGVPDDLRGEAPVAFVTLREGATLTEQALRTFARERIGQYKVPRHVYVVPALPRTPTGKILRRGLRDLLPAQQSSASA